MKNLSQVNNASPQVAKHKELVELIVNKVKDLQSKEEIVFPADYVPVNALRGTFLKLSETYDKNGKTVLEVCSKESIVNSLLKMVIQGLDPFKEQCHFIVYGNKLLLQRSYLGSIRVAKMLNPDLIDINANIVYEDDEFELEYQKGRTVIIKHKSSLKNMQSNKIIAAYAIAEYKSKPEESVIMSMDEIKQSWKQSAVKPILDDGSIKPETIHAKFTGEMTKRTVINRLCKKIINTSGDAGLVARIAKEAEADLIEADLEHKIETEAHKDKIDIYIADEDSQVEIITTTPSEDKVVKNGSTEIVTEKKEESISEIKEQTILDFTENAPF